MLQAVKIPEFSEVTWSGNRRLRKEAYWTQNTCETQHYAALSCDVLT